MLLCCSEVSISPLFRWPNSVNHFKFPIPVTYCSNPQHKPFRSRHNKHPLFKCLLIVLIYVCNRYD
ncbi:hypothetical protein EEK96_04820 [Escherichia coli]|nr:hypothetical protein [Escherichia coli]